MSFTAHDVITDWVGGGGITLMSSLFTGCRAHAHLILLLAVTLFFLVFYILWYRPSGIGLVVIINTSPSTTPSPSLSPSTSLMSHNDTKQEPSHIYKPKHSDDDSLVALLANLEFKNYGIVKNTDIFIMQDIPCL